MGDAHGYLIARFQRENTNDGFADPVTLPTAIQLHTCGVRTIYLDSRTVGVADGYSISGLRREEASISIAESGGLTPISRPRVGNSVGDSCKVRKCPI